MSQQHEFEVLESELLVDAPILALRRDYVRMPGGTAAHREIVEHFGAVAIVVINDADEVALIRQYRHSVGQRLWELPAGLLDVAQEDPLECAKRELFEEAGLHAREWALLSDIVTSPGFAEESIRIFIARGLTEQSRPEAEHEEAELELSWCPLDQAVSKALSGEIVNATAVAGILGVYAMRSGSSAPRLPDEPFTLRPEHLAFRRQREGITPDMKKV
ncbi:NUDIX domain-containing protein [Corynebacterium gerontici]|uniref:ADP-ribose pyrophosphatase n=1 Tax=Corynebacterium gerontici TaxID=2079234 RepID=A0A3G6J4M1_9CORY|nr:NUDIX hydrolase [Corynebacterium gerontici]AZA11360.1 ADP-ribose pyrophosphatase [Corynebacterium gerontici]